MVTRFEVREHASKESCWIIINGEVYDVTNFLDSHPGGSRAILNYAGKDATQAFEPIHSGDTLEKHLKPEQKLGSVAGSPPPARSGPAHPAECPKRAVVEGKKTVRLASIINIRDFEVAASQTLTPRPFAFFKAGADDELTAQWNRSSWQAIRFRPRVLRPVDSVKLSASILGNGFSAPFFICPAGGGKLAHPAGEVLMTKAAAKHGILHWVCNNAGCTQEEMANARAPKQTLYWQIYAMRDLAVTEQEIRRAVERGYKGFALTVDAVVAGKRERDMRMGIAEEVVSNGSEEENDDSLSGGISISRPPVWPSFDWPSAVRWLRGITDMPIAVKGIQCWEDAALCMQYGVQPWLSNHGGRQLEGAPSAAETLVEIRKNCPAVFDRCEVIVDGGITRGTDIVKAIALGAKGVGLGRAFLYALVFGEGGVSKAINILRQEVETAMALLGVTSTDQLNPTYVDTSALPYALAIARPHL